MRSLLFLVAVSSVAHAGRVVVLTERTDLPDALKSALPAQLDVEVVAEPMTLPPGELAFDRAAAAQHVAMTDNASAVVWIDGAEVWVVTADGRVVRHAPLADVSNPHVFAAIATHLLDELSPVSVTVTVATAPPAPEVFPPVSTEAIAPPPLPAPIARRRAPRLELSGGLIVGERGMGFAQNPPDVPATPPNYPYTGLGGAVLQASLFPAPEDPYGDDLTGFGLTFELQKSVNATLAENDTVNDTFGDYSLDYTAVEIGAHYRHKVGSLVVGAMVSYGAASWSLESDFPQSVPIPDTRYEHIDAGVEAQLAVGARARVGFGARYMHILSTGDMTEMEWYGPGSSSGLGLDLDLKVPLTDTLYLRGLLEYRRVSTNFDGDGSLSVESSLAVSNITDTWIMSGIQLGVAI